MTTLIFSNNSYCENDFIINELFPKNTRILYANPLTFINPSYYIENKVERGNCCLLFSINDIDFLDIVNISKFMIPAIIVQLSDKNGTNQEYVELASFTKLLVRQYYFQHYDYHKYSNILYIPLGYKGIHNNYFSNNINNKIVTERTYDWSFIGNVDKHNRSSILYQFILSKLMRYCMSNNISSTQILDIYSDSIFVPICQETDGIMDCFSTYEASVCGAIPIVVGDLNKLNNNIYLKEETPPWIFESNWSDAIKKCCFLINNPELLLKKQKDIQHWWKNRVKQCNQVISTNLLTYNKKSVSNEKIQIVIARFNENLHWTKDLTNVLICNKGLPIFNNTYGHQIINGLKNVGREGHTFYSYIYDNYDNLSEYTIFLQGNPFDHYPETLIKIKQLKTMDFLPDFDFFAIYISNIYLAYNIFYPDLQCNLDFIKAYTHIFETKPSQQLLMKHFSFGSGAQFIVSKDTILSRSREFYKRIIDLLSYNSNPIEGHIIERFHTILLSTNDAWNKKID